MQSLFSVGGPTTEAAHREQFSNGDTDSGHQHRRHGLFSFHHHHDSSDRHSGSNGSPHNSTNSPGRNHSPAGAPAATSRRTAYPDALPSALSKRFTGPTIGTAVLDENTMPLEEAAQIFELVTPTSTPLLKAHVKERFEAAIAEAIAHRRAEAQRQVEETSDSGEETSSNEAISTDGPRNNSFSFFKVNESIAGSNVKKAGTKIERQRRPILQDGGYIVFTDSYLSSHPNSVVTGLTSELQLAAPSEISAFHHRVTGEDAEKQLTQEVKDYIREAEQEFRPVFRRRNSAMVYGHAQYQQSSSPDVGSREVYYATPLKDSPPKMHRAVKKKSSSLLRKTASMPDLKV